MQAYAKPPALVELTLSGVMTVLQKTPTWEEAKKQLGDASFMEKLLKFDKDKLNDALLKKLQKFAVNPEFTPEVSPSILLHELAYCGWIGSATCLRQSLLLPCWHALQPTTVPLCLSGIPTLSAPPKLCLTLAEPMCVAAI